MSADGADSDGKPKQKFELYIKASAIDKETKGSCPICQQWFMITCLLGELQDDIDFRVYTVQADCPPKNFGVEQGWSKLFPVVMVLEGYDKKGHDLSGTKYDTFEELEAFFGNIIHDDNKHLKRKNAPNVNALKEVEDVYSAFNRLLPVGCNFEDSPSSFHILNKKLENVNQFLIDEGNKFLVDNVLTFADCYFLPRLQHIRVAGKAYMKYDIPASCQAIWRYLEEAYKTEAFRSTMPSDQDIVFHYEKKAAVALRKTGYSKRTTLQSFTFTLEIPDEIAAGLNGSPGNANGDITEVSSGVTKINIEAEQQEEEEDPARDADTADGGEDGE